MKIYTKDEATKRIDNSLTSLVLELKGYQGAHIRLQDILTHEAGIKITKAEAKRLIKQRS